MKTATIYYALASILDECEHMDEQHYREAILELMYHLEAEDVDIKKHPWLF